MNRSGIRWFAVASVLFLPLGASAAEPLPAGGTSSPDEWRDRAVMAKTPDARAHALPDEQSPVVAFSLQGLWLHPRQLQGEWLRVHEG